MIHFIPYPEPRTPKMMREDRIKSQKQAPYLDFMIPFYAGATIAFIAVILVLI